MKKGLLFLAALAASTGVFADEWTQPVYGGAFQPLTPGDTVYIYNTEAKQFLTEGNDWGTHATVGDTGLRFVVNTVAGENGQWDGKTYLIYDYTVAKSGWRKMFITTQGNIYMDNSEQPDTLFQFVDKGNNTYNIIGADANPEWSGNADMEGYMMGLYTDYRNERDGIQTGTGVIYDYFGEDNDYAPGTFLPTWAFVSQTDYAAYLALVEVYEEAVKLGKQIAEAETMGVTGIDTEKAVYANTSSTMEEIQAAENTLYAKVLKYYEESVTPDTPVTIDSDPCDNIDSWVNGIGATTWGTQTWIDGSWTGFEGTTLNIWAATLEGAAYKEMSGLPNGIYVVSMAAYSQSKDGYVFANENKKTVGSGAAGAVYQATTEVTDGTLLYGFAQDEAGTNWVALDNAEVKYYGCGVEAYRFWLSGLLESAPSFDDVTVMDSLINEYEQVLASVNTVQTKDEILAIIPAYEDILNKINTNANAYAKLVEACNTADELSNDELINTYYGSLLSDFVQDEADPVLEDAALNTDGVNAVTERLQALNDEAQNYVWDFETLTSEVENAMGIYEEYKDACSQEADDTYTAWMEKYAGIDFSNSTDSDLKTLLDELYDIEFKLTIPVDPASEENPVEYTSKIFNPSFADGANGWTNDGWGTCGSNSWTSFADGEVIDTQYLNLWNPGNARVYQTITNLPAGKYTLEIGAFADAEGMQVYANEDYKNVIAGQNETGEASVYDEDVEPLKSNTYYGNLYRIRTVVGEEGTLEIGTRIVNGGTVWGMVDNVKLFYRGALSEEEATGICESPATATDEVETIYTAAGIQRATMQKGLNIVKMKSGKTVKVLIK